MLFLLIELKTIIMQTIPFKCKCCGDTTDLETTIDIDTINIDDLPFMLESCEKCCTMAPIEGDFPPELEYPE